MPASKNQPPWQVSFYQYALQILSDSNCGEDPVEIMDHVTQAADQFMQDENVSCSTVIACSAVLFFQQPSFD